MADEYDPLDEVDEDDSMFTPTPKIDVKKDVEFRHLKDFDLKRLEEKFDVAKFERRINKAQVNRIAEAIEDGHFYDIVVTAIKKGNKFEIIDGQHRISAFKKLREDGKLEKHDIMIQIFSTNAREIYRRINSGQPLTTADFLKSMDNGKIPFFDNFSNWCAHYPGKRKIGYSTLAYAIQYAWEQDRFIFNRKDVVDGIARLKPEQATRLVKMFKIFDEITYMDNKSVHFRVPVLWNIIKVWLEGKATGDGLASCLKKMEKDKIVNENSRCGKSKDVMHAIYLRTKELME